MIYCSTLSTKRQLRGGGGGDPYTYVPFLYIKRTSHGNRSLQFFSGPSTLKNDAATCLKKIEEWRLAEFHGATYSLCIPVEHFTMTLSFFKLRFLFRQTIDHICFIRCVILIFTVVKISWNIKNSEYRENKMQKKNQTLIFMLTFPIYVFQTSQH